MLGVSNCSFALRLLFGELLSTERYLYRCRRGGTCLDSLVGQQRYTGQVWQPNDNLASGI